MNEWFWWWWQIKVVKQSKAKQSKSFGEKHFERDVRACHGTNRLHMHCVPKGMKN
jgi:hypothetical protein